MYRKIKKRIFEILEVAKPGDIPSRTFDIFIMGLISVNVIAVILETVKSLSIQYGIFFRNFEIFSIAVFTIEYILRIWTCTINEKFRQPILGRIQFALTPLLLEI
jgi:voltage-gated potassium channel